MKRAALALFALLLAGATLVPVLALATEKATATTTATATATTSALITYPEPEPDATAAEAKAETEWLRSGDGMNLAFALFGMGGIFGVIAWGILASRRASAV